MKINDLLLKINDLLLKISDLLLKINDLLWVANKLMDFPENKVNDDVVVHYNFFFPCTGQLSIDEG